MISHPHEDIEAFALGALDELEARRVLAHANSCPTCSILLADAMSTAAKLEPAGERPLAAPIAMGAIAARPTAGARDPVASFVRWASAFGAVAAIFALLIWNVNLRSNTLTVPVAALVHSHFEHHALHGGAGSAKVIQAIDGHWLYLVADGLLPRTAYRLWEISAGSPHIVGTMRTDSSGRGTGYWEQTPTKLSGFVLTPSDADTTSPRALRWP